MLREEIVDLERLLMRELKTRSEISDWLTRQLNAHPGCTETRLTVQYELQQPDAEDCNWSDELRINYGRIDEYAAAGISLGFRSRQASEHITSRACCKRALQVISLAREMRMPGGIAGMEHQST